MMVEYFQMGMVMVFGVMLMTAVRLRQSNKSVSVTSVMDQVQQALSGPVEMTRQQRRAFKKARRNRRMIGWAERRLISYCEVCKFKTKQRAFNHLIKMSKDANSANVDRVAAILEKLASGHGDTRFQDMAMELLRSTRPRQALKLQVEMINTHMMKESWKTMPKTEGEIWERLESMAEAA